MMWFYILKRSLWLFCGDWTVVRWGSGVRGQERRQRGKMRSESATVVQRDDRGLDKDDSNKGQIRGVF